MWGSLDRNEGEGRDVPAKGRVEINERLIIRVTSSAVQSEGIVQEVTSNHRGPEIRGDIVLKRGVTGQVRFQKSGQFGGAATECLGAGNAQQI